MQFNKLILSVTFLLGLGLTGLQAQEAVLASGGDTSGSGGSISYSVGQVVYTTNTGTSGYSVAEGVQQPYEISVVTSLDKSINIKLTSMQEKLPILQPYGAQLKNFMPIESGTEYQL